MSMTDLTKITTPFGLLNKETQDALIAHGGPYEYWASIGEWSDVRLNPAWGVATTYRVKPLPPKPREWWLCRDEKDHPFSVWDNLPADDVWSEVIHVREVLE
jgi:hypothetical protein